MEKSGIIEKTEEPTDWCAPIVPVPKPNGQVRICVDYKRLNRQIKRPNHMIPILEDIAPKMVGAKFFSTLDAAGGFHQIALDEKSSYLTTFITPYGRYRYKRLSMGISLGPEALQNKMEEILKGLEGCEPLSDDTVVHGKTEREHDKRLYAAMNRIEEACLRLNKEICVLKRREVKYFGQIINDKDMRPDEGRVEAILNMKEPRNVSELKTVLGMMNYLSKFVPHMSTILQPISRLLKKDTTYFWGPYQQKTFDTVKQKIANATVLAFYDVNRPTVASADACGYGLGATLLQDDGKKIQPIAFASRTLTESEVKYAQIEKECLASVWACEKFAKYLEGLPSFRLETDHKPLVPIMMTKDLVKTPLRCQRLLMRMMRFDAEVVHKPGKELTIADTLPRFPLNTIEEPTTVQAVESYTEPFENYISITPDRLNKIKAATVHDTTLQKVITYTLNGWPDKTSENLSKFRQVAGKLSVRDGLLIMEQRVVIPESERAQVLGKLHKSHQGINKCRKFAQETVWWPGLSTEKSDQQLQDMPRV
ncbi:Pol polyprotein [Plakobranchus ocellatus]|uniref:Pol polyprotein n=1 Tax=Plakobranchus ocellatus TaxID=259542 RepID=A0AAV4CSY0_9GAST|nr:Pol polyprotein [Plakobranchus ocellatus]